MPSLAATTPTIPATHRDALVWVVGAAVLALVVVAVGYLALCWLKPFTSCRHRNPLRRRAVLCLRCDGTGYRIRLGRHALNRFRATRGRLDRHAFTDPRAARNPADRFDDHHLPPSPSEPPR